MHSSTSQHEPDLFTRTAPETYPFVRTSPTSRAAAHAVQNAAAHRRRVLEYVAGCSQGATREEIEIALNLSGNTIRPRCVELINSGELIESSATRKTRSGRNAAVLVAPDPLRQT